MINEYSQYNRYVIYLIIQLKLNFFIKGDIERGVKFI